MEHVQRKESRMRKIKERTFPGARTKEAAAYEEEHRILARRAAAEGMVLLKNDGQVLPLKPGTELALFGAGASRTIKGGTGSGNVNERKSVSIFEGLTAAGYVITNPEWVQEYEAMYQRAREQWKEEILRKSQADPEHFFDVYSTTPFYIIFKYYF